MRQIGKTQLALIKDAKCCDNRVVTTVCRCVIEASIQLVGHGTSVTKRLELLIQSILECGLLALP
tara:strand:- start:464 stop:658 length:195 start_codon:yes stop_codon:yes gene_type:complete